MENIDIIFIDEQMPNLNGRQVINLLRGIKFNKLIIGITGNINNSCSEFSSCDIDYIFTKPLNKNKINIIFDFLNKNDINRYPNKILKIINKQLEWF